MQLRSNTPEVLSSILKAAFPVDAGEAELLKFLSSLARRFPRQFLLLIDQLLKSGDAPLHDNNALCMAAALQKAAELVGSDGRGAGGMAGYFARAAYSYKRQFCSLIVTMLKQELKESARNAPKQKPYHLMSSEEKARCFEEWLSDPAHRAQIAETRELLERRIAEQERSAQSGEKLAPGAEGDQIQNVEAAQSVASQAQAVADRGIREKERRKRPAQSTATIAPTA